MTGRYGSILGEKPAPGLTRGLTLPTASPAPGLTRGLEPQRMKAPGQAWGGVHTFITIFRQDCGMTHFVYIMASRPFGALYTGRTHDLRSRVGAHRAGLSAHTAKYNIGRLIWFEPLDDFETSLRRERSIKRWHRAWKIALITSANPDWRDVTSEIPDL